ncbi:hypothetical protein [Nocardia seriolae]|uniref:PIN domain-containing protein n=1 Tax=Nocardia seriolae TaxID=37332 RepID=A0A0B8NQR7_9NOCA|nr:hypothetical protein [Nocardia seriolae]APB01604.1 hypothetical protein NS506_07584 [Nocardia seriolae]MTJ60923.1 hypothetical protein [Nocardia seriolae]MTJ75294.1 hypothetical protein [Nocardia seriolae]MTJ90942.1 hypothetical protein [Nocardia seriolae]MTK34899.1 hypothetical protein [Nocardia seriolae]
MSAPVLLLDSTVLIAYERDLTRRAQTVVLEATVDGRLLVTTAISLAVACTELGTQTRELAWLVYDREGPLAILPLALNALEIGSAATDSKTIVDLEVANVVHEAHIASAVVLTYDPPRYAGKRIDVLDLRP